MVGGSRRFLGLPSGQTLDRVRENRGTWVRRGVNSGDFAGETPESPAVLNRRRQDSRPVRVRRTVAQAHRPIVTLTATPRRPDVSAYACAMAERVGLARSLATCLRSAASGWDMRTS